MRSWGETQLLYTYLNLELILFPLLLLYHVQSEHPLLAWGPVGFVYVQEMGNKNI